MSWDLDEAEAVELVREYLDAMLPPDDDVWVITGLDERDWGWIINWANSRHIQGSRVSEDLYAGAGPFLVDRRTGRVALCGSAGGPDYWAEQWRSGKLEDIPRPPSDSLPEPWGDLRWDWSWRRQSRAAMAAELKRETGPAHPLAAQRATPVAKCSHCDDVVFELSAGGFAFVHLTWSRHVEAGRRGS